MIKRLFIILIAFLSINIFISCDKKIEINIDSNNATNDSESNSDDTNNNQNSSNDNNNNDESKEENDNFEIDYSKCLFVSPNGNGDGTIESPKSLESALNTHSTSKIIYLLEGTYNLKTRIRLDKIGSKDNYYKIYAYKNQKVTLDFGKDYSKNLEITNEYNTESNKGLVIRGSYYHIKGIKVTNCGSAGIYIYGHNNIIENCILAKNGNTGLNIAGSSNKTLADWPSNNLIKNCTSYGNYDWNRTTDVGEDADGFGAKLTSGYNNVFDGCIAYNNSDDGWDLFTKHLTGKIAPVTIKNCIAFKNGYSLTGEELKNGNGFKLGGRALEVDHYVENCIAFLNKSNGFDDNSNPGTIYLTSCTGYKNGAKNFATGRFLEENNTYNSTWYENDLLMGPVENVSKSHNVFKNCISYLGVQSDSYCGNAFNCYFYLKENYYSIFKSQLSCNSKYIKGQSVLAKNPFISCEFSFNNLDDIHYLYRNEDSSISLKDFLKLKDEYKSMGANLE